MSSPHPSPLSRLALPAAIVVAGGLVATAVWMTRPNPRAHASASAQVRDRTGATAQGEAAPGPGRARSFDDGPHARTSVGSDELPDSHAAAPGRALTEAPSGGLPPVTDEVASQVVQAAAAAFEDARARVRKECWDALPADDEAPDEVTVGLSLSYDADGTVLASGVSEYRSGARAGLTGCMGPIAHGLSIPAPGTRISVQLDVTVP